MGESDPPNTGAKLAYELELVGLLENQGVACPLLKGRPLVALYYGDAGVRPMGDFDLLFHDATPRGRIQEIMTGPAGMRLKNRSTSAAVWRCW